jgi:hypothetical protein
MHNHKTNQSAVGSKELIQGHKRCQSRIDLLWKKGYRIEAVLYMSVLVEFGVREAILNFEQIIEGAALGARVGFHPRKLYTRKDIETQPLGYLIRILETYTKDKHLITDLRKFAETRNRCVHKILGCDFNEINRDLKGFDMFFFKLMLKVLQLNIKQMEHMDKSFLPTCDDCFKEIVKRQVKF